MQQCKNNLSKLNKELQILVSNIPCNLLNCPLLKKKFFDISGHTTNRVLMHESTTNTIIMSSYDSIQKICCAEGNLLWKNKLHSAEIRDIVSVRFKPQTILSISLDANISMTDIHWNKCLATVNTGYKLWSCCFSNIFKNR